MDLFKVQNALVSGFRDLKKEGALTDEGRVIRGPAINPR